MKKLPALTILLGLTLTGLTSCGCSEQAPVVTYTVSFKNWDGTLLSESKVNSGGTVTYQGLTPTRPETAEYEYTFKGWDQSLENILSDCTRVAQYNEVAKPVTVYHTVSFKNWDGTLICEDIVEHGGTAIFDRDDPVRPETSEYKYTFNGWDEPLTNIISDCTRIAQFTETAKPVTNRYTVTFKNWDGSILSQSLVDEGQDATYSGPIPTRPSTSEFTYVFTGWDGSLKEIYADCVRIAQFSQTDVEYTVKFYSYDNQLLYTDTVHYQESASYYGPIPTKPSTETHTYTFKEWDKDYSCITKSISVYPIFDEVGVTSHVTVRPNNGQSEYDLAVTYDEAYDLGIPTNPGLAFGGWYLDDTTLIPSSGTWTYTGVSIINARWESGNFNFTLNSDNVSYSVSLTTEGKTVSEIIIPSSYNDLPVTVLEADFAKSDTSIERVVIPGTIKSIPADSFNGCTELSEVIFNDGLLTIGDNAFKSCKLQKVIIPSTCTSIGGFAFDLNSNLYHVYIPDSVTSMGTYAFDDINSLAYICIGHTSTPTGWPSSWTGKTVYTKSTKLVETDEYNYVVTSNYGDLSVTILRLGTETSKLQSFTFPSEIEGITDIKVGIKLFYNNLYLRTLDLGGVTRINDYAFTYCSNLNTVTFSNSLTYIGKSAFRYCTSLTRVELPDSLTNIQEMAFDGCSNLTYVYLPKSVLTIGQYAFDDCDKATIYTTAHATGSSWASSWNGSSPAEPVYYDFVSLDEAEDFNYVVQSYQDEPYISIISIKDSAKTKKNIVIPDEIDGISDIRLVTKLFYGFSELVSIDVGSGVTSIPESCFYNCSKLETVILHDGLKTIGKTAFYNCSKLSSINMPSTLTSIGYSSFDHCSSLREVVIPLSVTTIGSYAFDVSGKMALLIEVSADQPNWASNWYGANTSNKQFVYDYVSRGVVGAFRYAKASNGVTNTVYILGLKEGSNATNLVLPDQIEGISNIKISPYAFQNNTIMKTIDLGNSVTFIGAYAFGGCTSLASVIIPASCTIIKSYAFANCPKTCALNCMAESLPSTWESNWNNNSCQVVWGYVR